MSSQATWSCRLFKLSVALAVFLTPMASQAAGDPEGVGPPDSYDPRTGVPWPPRKKAVKPALASKQASTVNQQGTSAAIPAPIKRILIVRKGPPAAPVTTLLAPLKCSDGAPCDNGALGDNRVASDNRVAGGLALPSRAIALALEGKGPALTGGSVDASSDKLAGPADKPDDSGADSGFCDEESFYKGELGSFSGKELEGERNSIMIGLGYYNVGGLLGGSHYLALAPRLNLHFDVAGNKKLDLSFEVPLNITLWDKYLKGNIPGSERIRKADYDEMPYDLLKMIKRVRLGRKEDRIYINIGPLYGASLGHGTVMRRYSPNLDPDRIRVGLQLDGYIDYGGFETVIADMGFKSRVIGLLVFVKPLSFISKHYFMKSVSLGVHYTSDTNAPRKLQTDEYGVYQRDDTGNLLFDATHAGFLGFDFEMKPVRLCNLLDIKLYSDFSLSTVGGKGRGITGGMLVRSNIGLKPLLNAFRIRLEYRVFDNNYLPNYFDSLYDVHKFQYIRGRTQGNEPTKYNAILAPARKGSFARGSLYGEVSYALVDYVSLGAGLEKYTAGTDIYGGGYNLILHAEVPALDFLRFFLTYQKFNFTDLGDVFAFLRARKVADDEVFYAQARVKILPFMYLNALIMHTYKWEERVSAGIGGFKSNLDYRFDTEIGFEF